MSSYSKSDNPAAKVVMKVPTPDSLVEVRVSPPDSNFEVRVSPGDDAIELHIRPGSSSFVEVRISPPADVKALGKLAGESQISMAGSTMIYQIPAAGIPAAANRPAELPASANEPQSQDAAAEAEFEERADSNSQQYFQPAEEKAEAKAKPSNIPPDITTFSEGVFTSIDESGKTAEIHPADNSGIPGPDPSIFENQGQQAPPPAPLAPPLMAEDSTFRPEFIDIDEEEKDYWPPEEEGPSFGAVASAAQEALARLSAAVERERAEMAANPAVRAFSAPEYPDDSLDGDELDEPDGLSQSAFKSQPENSDDKDIDQAGVEMSYGSSRKLPSADATIMVQMYEDTANFNPAADTLTPLPEEEEMEIGHLGEEMSLGAIDVDGLEDIDLDKSQMPRKHRGGNNSVPRAKPLSTVVPGNTIIPK